MRSRPRSHAPHGDDVTRNPLRPSRRRALVAGGIAAVVLAALAAGCGSDSSSSGASTSGSSGSITVYSGQHEQTVAALTADFTTRTGIEVALRSGGEGELANQVLQEGSGSPADVFYAGNPPALGILAEKGLLAPVDPATLAAVPAEDSSPDGVWTGVSARASVLAYNTSKLAEGDLPGSLLDLADPAWKGKIAFAPTETDFQPLVTAVIRQEGEAAAETWLKGLKDNASVYEDNEAIIAAVNRGDIAAGLVEHYYWYRLRDELGAGEIDSALHYFAAGDPGGLVAVSGAGILKSSSHQADAQAFLKYLVSRPAQEIIVNSKSYEYPLLAGVSNPKLERTFDALKPPSVSISDLGDGREAFALMQKVGLL